MSKLTGTVKIFGTNLYSGCGHGAVKGFDTCPRCRIEELQAQQEEARELVSAWSARCDELQRKHDALLGRINEFIGEIDYGAYDEGWWYIERLRALLKEDDDE